ncbi:MAG: methionine-gamma-lyase [Polaribacter sp.]|jgi:methionine-gamma-lyase
MKKKSFASLCVKEQADTRTTKPHQLPIYATSSFEFENINQGMDIFIGKTEGHVYGRYGNPTIDTVANKIALLETYGLDIEAKAIMFSSGMSAISTLFMGVLKSGDKVLTQGDLYGGTTELLLKILGPLGIETIMTDLKDLDNVESLLKANPAIKLVYFETPANPTMACVDIEAIANLSKKYGKLSAIDSTFCTPYIQQPLKFGIDFVIHSSTKYLNGHGNSISGVVIGTDLDLMNGKILKAMRLTGTNCNPWDAWLTNNGLKTLALRMEQHCKNAMAIAEYMEKHPKILHVNYNGLPSHPDHEIAKKQMSAFGGMLSFELKGGLDAGIQFMNNVEFCSLAPTLGDVDTLIIHPASSSHVNVDKEMRERNGISDGLIRLSVGIEGVEDLIEDMEKGFGQGY